MINIIYEDLPESIRINSKSYPVFTDFRDWIAFIDMFNDENLNSKEKLLLSLRWFSDTVPDDLQEAFNGLVKFASADEISFRSGKSSAGGSSAPVLSYLYDSTYIFSAFLQVYSINLRTIEYMHWYEFRALLDGLPETTPLQKRMAYRAVNIAEIKDKKERSRIRKIQRDIALPSRELSAYDAGSVFG